MQKRGLLLIIVVLVIVLLRISSALQLEEASKVAELGSYTGDARLCDREENTVKIHESIPDANCFSERSAHPDGCLLYSVQSCGDCISESDCAGIRDGVIVTQTKQEFLWNQFLSPYETPLLWGSLAENIGCKHIKTGDGNQYLCADKWWRKCSLEDSGNLGKIAWTSENYLYNCTLNRDFEFPEWVKIDIDLDHDGYTISQDCQDNPTSDLPQCQDLELPQDCAQDPIKYSECAICINPDAPEVCGDGINNDCGGPGKHESVDELNGATSDNCNKEN